MAFCRLVFCHSTNVNILFSENLSIFVFFLSTATAIIKTVSSSWRFCNAPSPYAILRLTTGMLFLIRCPVMWIWKLESNYYAFGAEPAALPQTRCNSLASLYWSTIVDHIGLRQGEYGHYPPDIIITVSTVSILRSAIVYNIKSEWYVLVSSVSTTVFFLLRRAVQSDRSLDWSCCIERLTRLTGGYIYIYIYIYMNECHKS